MAEETTTEEAKPEDAGISTHIYSLRSTANREDQVIDFLSSNVQKLVKQRITELENQAAAIITAEKDKKKQKELMTAANIPLSIIREKVLGEKVTKEEKEAEIDSGVYSAIHPHGMRGYVFVEASSRQFAEQASYGIPYARGILPSEIQYKEIEHMLEQVKKEVNIQKNDICEIISGPFKREKAKITRVDKSKEEVVVELLESAVPIPITVRMDSIKVIRRD